MSINYSYEIVSVDLDARCMEIIYSAVGYPRMHIGARLPFENEILEDIIRVFAPIPFWLDSMRIPVSPPIGTSGTVNAEDEELSRITAIKNIVQPISIGTQTL